MPDVLRLHDHLLVGDILVHGDLLHAADILEQQEDHALFLLVQLGLVLVQILQQGHGVLAGGELIQLLAQHAHGLAAVAGGALGCAGDAVVVQQAQRVAVGGHLLLQLFELGLGFIQSHRDIPPVIGENEGRKSRRVRAAYGAKR